jgi:hypothetical protein
MVRCVYSSVRTVHNTQYLEAGWYDGSLPTDETFERVLFVPYFGLDIIRYNDLLVRDLSTVHTVINGTVLVRYHCGGWSEEVNSCILILSHMVYL